MNKMKQIVPIEYKDSGIEIVLSTMSLEASNINLENESKNGEIQTKIGAPVIKEEEKKVETTFGSDSDIKFTASNDYSILMYETKDAFDHSKNLRLKLQQCNEQLQMKNNQFREVSSEKAALQETLTETQYLKQQNDDRLSQKIIDLFGRVEWLEGQNERMKRVCKKWKNNALGIKSPKKSASSDQERQTDNSIDNNEDFDTTINHEELREELILDNEKETVEEKPSNPNEEEHAHVLTKRVNAITCLSNKNDISIQKLASNCHNLIKDNSKVLEKMCEENRVTGTKLESWIESYMILKRKTEDGEEIYQRELQKSWNIEREYKTQIKNLCEMITRLTCEVNEAREKNNTMEKSFKNVIQNLKELDHKFDLIVEMTNEKVAITEGKLRDLVTKCDHLNNSPSLKKRTPSKRFSRSLFKLKRRMSESNESLQDK